MDYQIILRKPFCRQTNAVTCWGTEEYQFSFNSRKLWIECKKDQCSNKIVNNFLLRAEETDNTLRERILKQFDDLFVEDLKKLSCTNVVVHDINTGVATPIRMKPRRFSPGENEEILKLL